MIFFSFPSFCALFQWPVLTFDCRNQLYLKSVHCHQISNNVNVNVNEYNVEGSNIRWCRVSGWYRLVSFCLYVLSRVFLYEKLKCVHANQSRFQMNSFAQGTLEMTDWRNRRFEMGHMRHLPPPPASLLQKRDHHPCKRVSISRQLVC